MNGCSNSVRLRTRRASKGGILISKKSCLGREGSEEALQRRDLNLFAFGGQNYFEPSGATRHVFIIIWGTMSTRIYDNYIFIFYCAINE